MIVTNDHANSIIQNYKITIVFVDGFNLETSTLQSLILLKIWPNFLRWFSHVFVMEVGLARVSSISTKVVSKSQDIKDGLKFSNLNEYECWLTQREQIWVITHVHGKLISSTQEKKKKNQHPISRKNYKHN